MHAYIHKRTHTIIPTWAQIHTQKKTYTNIYAHKYTRAQTHTHQNMAKHCTLHIQILNTQARLCSTSLMMNNRRVSNCPSTVYHLITPRKTNGSRESCHADHLGPIWYDHPTWYTFSLHTEGRYIHTWTSANISGRTHMYTYTNIRK